MAELTPCQCYWLQSPRESWRECQVLAFQGGQVARVKDLKSGRVENINIRTSTYHRTNEGQAVDDVTSLYFLNEPALVDNLERRYRGAKARPYTFMSSVLLSVNPLRYLRDPEKRRIAAGKLDDAPPHPYTVAETAYRSMRKRRGQWENQSMLISGESGSGKTETSKMILDYLTVRGTTTRDKESERDEEPAMPEGEDEGEGEKEEAEQENQREIGHSFSTLSSRVCQASPLGQRLMETIPILEAFGNAKTQRNHNSSRFGKYMRLHFSSSLSSSPSASGAADGGRKGGQREDRDGPELLSASIDTYLLEKSRLVSRPAGERNFHIFYMLLAGLEPSERAEFDLCPSRSYAYLQPEALSPDSADSERFIALRRALKAIGISPETQVEIFRVVCGCLHLGNIEIGEEETEQGTTSVVGEEEGRDALRRAALCLGLEEGALERAMLEKKISRIRSRGSEYVVKRDRQTAIYARDSVAKIIYGELFSWIMKQITESLESGTSPSASLPYIGVLDIFGFESFAVNGFEQLLINFANESLQNLFVRAICQREQALYREENLQTVPIAFEDNSELIELFASRPGGIFAILDGVARGPDPSDKKFIDRVHSLSSSSSSSSSLGGSLSLSDARRKHLLPRPHPRDVHEKFIVRHFAGCVTYTVENFLDKNSNIISPEIGELLLGSTDRIVSSLLPPDYLETLAQRKSSLLSKSVSALFVQQMTELIGELESTSVHYIRCFKPNKAMEYGAFDRLYVAQQLRQSGTVSACEVLKVGLPTRLPYKEVRDMYKEARERGSRGETCLSPSGSDVSRSVSKLSDRLFVEALVSAFSLPRTCYQLGSTRIFFRVGRIEEFLQKMERLRIRSELQRVNLQIHRYRILKLWKVAIAKIVAHRGWVDVLQKCRRNRRAMQIQSFWRRCAAEKELRQRKRKRDIRRRWSRMAESKSSRERFRLCPIETRHFHHILIAKSDSSPALLSPCSSDTLLSPSLLCSSLQWVDRLLLYQQRRCLWRRAFLSFSFSYRLLRLLAEARRRARAEKPQSVQVVEELLESLQTERENDREEEEEQERKRKMVERVYRQRQRTISSASPSPSPSSLSCMTPREEPGMRKRDGSMINRDKRERTACQSFRTSETGRAMRGASICSLRAQLRWKIALLYVKVGVVLCRSSRSLSPSPAHSPVHDLKRENDELKRRLEELMTRLEQLEGEKQQLEVETETEDETREEIALAFQQTEREQDSDIREGEKKTEERAPLCTRAYRSFRTIFCCGGNSATAA